MTGKGLVQMAVAGVVCGMAGAGLFAAFADGGDAFPSVERVLTQGLDDQCGREVRMDVVTFPPGAKSPDHRHPGHVFVYVLEGEVDTRIGDGDVTRYEAGDSFYEPSNAVHADTRNPSESETARILAIMIAEEGKPSLQLAH